VQEIIYQLWQAYGSYDNKSRFSTWMYRVALNVAISWYRKEKRRNELISPLTGNIIELTDEPDPPDKEHHLKLLQQFINELNELDRALMLLYLDEKSGKEIAEILGLSETNIRTKINRIKEKLKQKFSIINN
jgi:RNA polymerase sigma factor (sigma-70 family)